MSLAVLLAALAAAPRARADATAEERAAADQLYDDAGKLMRASRWAEARPKLEAASASTPQ